MVNHPNRSRKARELAALPEKIARMFDPEAFNYKDGEFTMAYARMMDARQKQAIARADVAIALVTNAISPPSP